jgi:S-DNA-T family DNA segregation ATPase FtsK/SpoIIIE
MTENKKTYQMKQSPSHRKQIWALLGIVTSLMLLLSIISYSAADQASGEISLGDLWKIFSNDELILLKAERTENWLGLLGAIISSWFINSTIGYWVIIVPLLGFVWSVYLLNGKNLRKKVILTNYTIILAVLFATTAGLLRQLSDSLPIEWSGVVGHFIAYVLANSLGATGAILCVALGFIVMLTLLADLDYAVTWARLRDYVSVCREWIGRKMDAWKIRRSAKLEERESRRFNEPVQIKKPSETICYSGEYNSQTSTC